LLCLLAISNVLNGERRLQPYSQIEKMLCILLKDFGPPRKILHPEYPFWFMQNDENIWEVRSDKPLHEQPSGSPTRAELLRGNAEGGFKKPIYDAISRDGVLRLQIIEELLEAHFPETMHEEIIQCLNLVSATSGPIKCSNRDPQFREKILSAYEYRCAVCGFNVRIGQVVIALEAAHIKWYQAGGPDIHQNGLALCALHHKLFDRGAFTIGTDHSTLVSERAYGTDGFIEHLGRYHKKPLLRPNRESYRPKDDFINWHMREVFLAPTRE
jgi:putative restriction endonuclease